MTLVKQVLLPLADIKAGPEDDLDEGEFIVYPSTFTRTPDAYGDVVAPGAFAEGIEFRKKNGITLPGLFGHRLDDPTFWIASAQEEEEDDHGWKVRGVFDLADSDVMARKVYRLVKSKRLRELSFAYDVLDSGRVEVDAPGAKSGQDPDKITANELRKLETYEFSFVPIGANRDTSVVAVKSATEALVRTLGLTPDDLKAGRVLSAKNESALRAAYEQIGAVLDALPTSDDEAGKTGAVVDQHKDEDPAAGKSEDAARSAASVAVSIALESALADFDEL